jgi:hypothetical protein
MFEYLVYYDGNVVLCRNITELEYFLVNREDETEMQIITVRK